MTLLTGGGPKVAAFAWGLRFLVMGLLPLAVDWQEMLVILAALSLDCRQYHRDRPAQHQADAAYSAISNMGFVLLGLLSGVVDGKTTSAANAYGSAMFYSIVYMITTLGTFGVVMLLARRSFEAETIDDFKGLNQRSPVFAFVMMVMMFSLAGIPPAVGFLRQARRARSGDERGVDLAGGAGGDHIAVRRVLLPAYRQADVLRRPGRYDADQRARGQARAADAERRRRAGARYRPWFADDRLPAGDHAHTALPL